jgi:kinetochore protein NNF1
MPPAEPTIQSQPQLPPPAAADQTETGNEEEADPGPDPEPGHTTEQEKQTPAAAPAATPVVPGPRATRLQQLFASVAKRTLDKIDADNFGACFPTIRDKAPRTLEAVQRQMVERLGSLWNVRYSNI